MKSIGKIISLVMIGSLSFPVVSSVFAQDKNQKIDPSVNFKLIGVFQVGGKQKAIIENLGSSTGGRQEYSVGDFLDEMQTISIAKIINSPTVKVEILDSEGGHYLMRPSSIDSGSRPSGSSSSYSSGYKKPSAFANKFKSKQQKPNAFTDDNQGNSGSDENSIPPDNSTPPPPDSPPPDTMVAEIDNPEPPADTATQNNSQPGNTNAAPTNTTPPGEDVFGRPSNPFD